MQINGQKGHGTVTGLFNTTWDEKKILYHVESVSLVSRVKD
ncbi:hypothetical protein HMPREF3033_00423 [Veillonellaceae bacterium DNF00751]|nr:hypothetical protein HMPREF3033_00423 [Veillonellaceae bacterium DNF00751]